MQDEIWKDIDGYKGRYQVSNKGRIKSLARKGRIKDMFLKPAVTKKGYLQVSLTKNSSSHSIKVHRLVASTFLDNKENKPQVNHIDGDKKNNTLSNLEFVTATDNISHAYKIGLACNKGENNPFSKLTDDIVFEIKCLLQKGIMGVDIARKFEVTKTTISDIKNNRSWNHIKF